jgi:hypothetical protein
VNGALRIPGGLPLYLAYPCIWDSAGGDSISLAIYGAPMKKDVKQATV